MAVRFYQECLGVCQQIGLPWLEIRARSNLVEALAEQGQQEEALQHWQAGLTLSVQAGFDDDVAYFRDLQSQFPLLENKGDGAATATEVRNADDGALTPDEQAALTIAAREGKVTPKLLMEETDISKATATRRLAGLVEKARLEKRGEGRGTYYVLLSRSQEYGSHSPIQHGVSGEEASAGPSMLELERLRRLLEQQAAMLESQFGVTAFGWIDQLRTGERSQAIVRFSEAPDALQFFRLEYAIAQLLDIELDLLPEESLQWQEREVPVIWLWEAKSVADAEPDQKLISDTR